LDRGTRLIHQAEVSQCGGQMECATE
jgi:hypothetical protein